MARPAGGLEGMSVLVTGGGTGIGAACAKALVADGAAVTICGRREDVLQASAERIRKAARAGGRVQAVVADVTDEASVEALVARALELTGRLDGCIANAGGGGGMGPYHVQNTSEFVRVLHLNVLSTMLCVKHTVPHMVEAGGGSFVGMSSIAGHVTHPYFGAYCVGKAGIEEMMKNCADEFGARRVRFNSIRPGFIATEIMAAIPHESPTYQSYLENTPMRDVGQPEDVGALARFLIGPESRWITGTAINVDGGHHLRRGPDFGPFLEPMLGARVMAGERPAAAGATGAAAGRATPGAVKSRAVTSSAARSRAVKSGAVKNSAAKSGRATKTTITTTEKKKGAAPARAGRKKGARR